MRYSDKNYQVFGFNDNGCDIGFIDDFDAVETPIVCSWSAVDGVCYAGFGDSTRQHQDSIVTNPDMICVEEFDSNHMICVPWIYICCP